MNAKRASKSVHLSFDTEMEAMALIKKAMDMVYPGERERILKWAVSRLMEPYCDVDVSETIVIRKTRAGAQR